MRIVLAPGSYKGCLTALGVADAMALGVERVFPDAELIKAPIADGGEGTVDALVTATGGQHFHSEVTGPLGEHVRARWGVLGDGKTAVIETAATCGLTRVPAELRNSLTTTSRGTGELIRAALDAGLRKILLGIGEDASNDAGAGMARALGVRFAPQRGKTLPEGGAALKKIKAIDLSGLDPRLQETEISVACDIDNPLFGPRGAAAFFGPQKGAPRERAQELELALRHFASLAQAASGRVVAELPGAGAAGGLGAGLLLFTPARLKTSVDLVLDAIEFSGIVEKASFVITGEGRTDFQTAFGKAPVGVAKRAKPYNVPVFCLSGGLGEGADEVLAQGIDAVLSICDRPLTLEDSMNTGAALIESASTRLCRIIAASRRGFEGRPG